MSNDERMAGDDKYVNKAEAFYRMRLFVTGASTNSVRAVSNIKKICDQYLAGRYELEIIDVHQQQEIAEKEQLIAVPLLIRTFPKPERRMVGDMSNTKHVLRGLEIKA